jgi:hypothetical protein
VNSLGCLTTVSRDTIFATGRAQAANNAGLRFGTGLISGLAVGGLCPRFRPMRSNLAHTALRLYPSDLRSARHCGCLYRKLKHGHSSDEVRPGWRVN